MSPDEDFSALTHWDRVYQTTPHQRLGWYETVAEKSLRLVERAGISRDDRILDIGSGASTLIDSLLARGYRDLVAADISRVALDRTRSRIGPKGGGLIRWVVDDVTNPSELLKVTNVALWHDRAMLHFLLDDFSLRAYRNLLQTLLEPGGWVAIAAFSKTGAKRCSGLDVRNYDVDMLSDFLGNEFECVEHFDHVYETPLGGRRPYVYALFRHLLGSESSETMGNVE